jgi:predicted nucleic acid-binding protein
VIVADSSVVIPAALPWHEHHAVAISSLQGQKTQLLAPVLMETYSVLTRLPPPQRLAPELALRYLREKFEFPPLMLPPESYERLLTLTTKERIVGGAVYDALIGTVAREFESTLLTLDRRATPIYEIVGVDYRVI